MKNTFRTLALSSVFAVLFVSNTMGLPQEKGNAKVITNSYSSVITWVTDKPATSQIEYGENVPYADETSEDSNLVIYHEVTLFDLKPSTAYNYRIKSKDAYGNESVSKNLTFKTLKSPPKDQPPQISDIEASVIIAAGPIGPDEKPEPKPKPKQTSKKEQEKKKKLSVGTKDAEPESKQMIKKETAVKRALQKKGGILFKKGKWQIEPTTTYYHTSANKIVISGYTVLPLIIGEVSTENIKRDIVIESIAVRYGLNDMTQLELNIPYRYQHERTVVDSPASETTQKDSGIGDISVGISRQIVREKGWRPDMILGLNVKSRTGQQPYGNDIGLGTGHWGLKTSLVAVKSSDPAVVFGSLAYAYNFARNDVEGYGTIKPGNSISYSLGLAFGLNYQIALSIQLQQTITQKTRLNQNSIANSFSNVANVKYGLTWSVNKNFSCELSASQGLTVDSPDLVVQVSFPFSF